MMLIEKPGPSLLSMSKLCSLGNILKDQFQHYTLDYSGYHYDIYGKFFYISDNTGHFKPLYAIDLIKHPRLLRILRKHPHYPCYDCKIPINSDVHEHSLNDLISELQQFENTLSSFQQEKIRIDQEINNLLFIHQGDEVKPIYLGQKPFYMRNNYNRKYGTQINISGTRYFMDIYTYKRKYKSTQKEKLYHLDAYTLLQSHRTWSHVKGHHTSVLDIPDLQHISFVGGVINTPILAFRCKRDTRLKGKIYYLDLQTNKLTAKFTEARKMAQCYGQSLQLDN